MSHVESPQPTLSGTGIDTGPEAAGANHSMLS
jgi:hypothetical protein